MAEKKITDEIFYKDCGKSESGDEIVSLHYHHNGGKVVIFHDGKNLLKNSKGIKMKKKDAVKLGIEHAGQIEK